MPAIAFGTYASDGREAPAVICEGAVYDAGALREAGLHVPQGNWSNGEAAQFLENLCADRSDWVAIADGIRAAAAAGDALPLALTMGDPAGIGGEIALAA